jgi:hypothetical protein
MQITTLKKSLVVLLSLIAIQNLLIAQVPLPAFSAVIRNGNTIISWYAPAEKLTLLVIQKSTDSVQNFKSVASMPDPNTPNNGYVDKKIPTQIFFYRIFYVGINGKYYFTRSSRATKEAIPTPDLKIFIKDTLSEKNKILPTALSLPEIAYTRTPDTLDYIPKKDPIDPLKIYLEKTAVTTFKPMIETEKIGGESILKTNPLLFINKENNLMLILPDINKRKFHLHVYKEDGTNVFQMRNIKDPHLLIDKSNFIYSGWFKYEMFEGELLIEKGRFLINTN